MNLIPDIVFAAALSGFTLFLLNVTVALMRTGKSLPAILQDWRVRARRIASTPELSTAHLVIVFSLIAFGYIFPPIYGGVVELVGGAVFYETEMVIDLGNGILTIHPVFSIGHIVADIFLVAYLACIIIAVSSGGLRVLYNACVRALRIVIGLLIWSYSWILAPICVIEVYRNWRAKRVQQDIDLIVQLVLLRIPQGITEEEVRKLIDQGALHLGTGVARYVPAMITHMVASEAMKPPPDPSSTGIHPAAPRIHYNQLSKPPAKSTSVPPTVS